MDIVNCDSVTRALRKKLNMFLNENYAVDLIEMSYSVLDNCYTYITLGTMIYEQMKK